MTTRTKGTKEPGPADEEFLQQLHRGGELLGAGKVTEAKDFLERAHQLQPRHEKAQNLLGLTYFKLGLFDRAAELYEMLVRDNPVDPTLRVNLGLVYLKTNALQRAAREFETATDLAPDHKKAHNYLGLTFAQMGEYGRAREHFLLSGSDAMAEKMSRAIAGEAYSRPPAAPAPAPARPRDEEGSAT
ncbi:tetratricopeptide repeat protein, partial [Corallococcus aberystwythensis]